MLLELQRMKWWIVTNGLGAAAFIYSASKTWLEPELRGEDVARGGDAVVWFISALPILLLFLIANLIWIGFALVRLAKAKDWRPAAVAFGVLAAWLGITLFDQLNH